jgi:hypothetical protein
LGGQIGPNLLIPHEIRHKLQEKVSPTHKQARCGLLAPPPGPWLWPSGTLPSCREATRTPFHQSMPWPQAMHLLPTAQPCRLRRCAATPPCAMLTLALTFAWMLLGQVSSFISLSATRTAPPRPRHQTMLDRTPKAHSFEHDHEPLALHQQKAALPKTKGAPTNGTLLLLKSLAAFCMLGNVTAQGASATPTCGCSEGISEAISALRVKLGMELRVEFQAKYDAQQALIDSIAHEVQDVRECSACVSPSPPPPKPLTLTLPPPKPPNAPKPPCATPIDFVLVLDESGSMKKPLPEGSMEGPGGLKAFAKQLVNQYFLGVDTARFSVVSFAANATIRVPWSYNAADINAGIDGMSADGKTSISDGFEAAQQLFADDGRVGATKVVLLVSDGEQTVDAAPGKTLLETAVDAAALVKGDGATVFAWGFGDKVSSATLEQIATDSSKVTLAQELAELTGTLVLLEAAVCNESPALPPPPLAPSPSPSPSPGPPQPSPSPPPPSDPRVRPTTTSEPPCADPETVWICHSNCHDLGGHWPNFNLNHPAVLECKLGCKSVCLPPMPPTSPVTGVTA